MPNSPTDTEEIVFTEIGDLTEAWYNGTSGDSGIDPTTSMYVCSRCGSAIPELSKIDHIHWHSHLTAFFERLLKNG